jgi:hypothetical protein
MSTFATLLIVPSIFALVIGRKAHQSPSIYPDDRESANYDPKVFVDEGAPGHDGEADHDGKPRRHEEHADRDADALAFLRRILDEARSMRHDMVTHYTIDDLRAALGFARPRSDGTSAGGTGERASADSLSDPKGRAPVGGPTTESGSSGPSNAPP